MVDLMVDTYYFKKNAIPIIIAKRIELPDTKNISLSDNGNSACSII